MEFRSNIKNLRKEFFGLVNEYQGKSSIILKMISSKGMYRLLDDADIAFRTCMLYSFSDKSINKLYYKNKGKAIKNLRVRAIACLQIADCIEDVIIKTVGAGDRYIVFIEGLLDIDKRIKMLARNSINLANGLAIKYGYPIFENDRFLDKDKFEI